ncbi:MAG: AAA family ATPase [Rhodospirillales bacterium]|nr:AAA family ATPase [Rhodospirillales bacterium]MCB9995388.1 AAA family ATPase [Rhodospirillales bacterium]
MPLHKAVEVVGLPGCGKTTYIRAQMAQISQYYTVVESRKRTLASRLRTRLGAIVLRKRYPDLPDDFIQKLSYRLSFRLSRHKDACVFYFDSGFCQFALEYLIATDFKDRLAVLEALKGLPVPDALIYMYDDPDAVIDREMQRPARRYPDLDRAELARRYKKAEEVLKEGIFPLAKAVYPANLAAENDFEGIMKA